MIGLKDSFRGIINMFRSERNFKIQIVLLCITILLGLYFSITKIEWLIIVLISSLVLSLEIINSAVERICDFVHIEKHDKIKWIKDVAAGAVLVGSLGAVVVGGLIFLPHLMKLFSL